MEVREFGKDNSRRIVLIPGNMMSWRQFEHVIPLLEKEFHVIAVSTDGYDGTGETAFTTAAASAEKLEIPFGTHTIRIVRFDREGVSSREGNEHVPVWNHDITLIPLDDHHKK